MTMAPRTKAFRSGHCFSNHNRTPIDNGTKTTISLLRTVSGELIITGHPLTMAPYLKAFCSGHCFRGWGLIITGHPLTMAPRTAISTLRSQGWGLIITGPRPL